MQALSDSGFDVVARIECSDNLALQVSTISPDIIIIDMEKPDEHTLMHLKTISTEHPRPVVMFTAEEDSTTINAAIQAGVSAYVVDNLSPSRVKPIVEVAIARFQHMRNLMSELDSTRVKLSQRRVIDQAKGIIMNRRGINEEQAYGVLRKMAMEKSDSVIDVARNIIEVSEMLS